MAKTIDLAKPITIGNQTIKALTLREPVGGDIAKHGYPLRLAVGGSGGTSVEVNGPALSAMLSELAGEPPSTINQLSIGDYNRAAVALVGFFGDSIQDFLPSGISI